MPPPEQQLETLYNKTERLCEKIAAGAVKITEASTNISWIRKDLEKGNEKFIEHEKRIRKMEGEGALLKAKIGAVVIFLTLCATIVINSFGWLIAHLWGR